MFSYVSVEARLRPNHPLRAIQALTDEALAAMETSLQRWLGHRAAIDRAANAAAHMLLQKTAR